MRRTPIALLLAAALAVPGACLAQAQPQAAAETPDADAPMPRSAFGKVMAVMIRALQHQRAAQAAPGEPVRTTAAGTPMDIEIGANFRDALSPRTGTGGATAAPAPRVAPPEPPEELALRQATLAGPG